MSTRRSFRVARAVSTTVVAALALFVVALTSAPAAMAASRAPRLHPMPPRGTPLPVSQLPLVDHGGPVLARANLYAIWWGRAAAFPSDAQSAMTSFLDGLNGSRHLQLLTQYLRGATPTLSKVTNLVDPAAPPRSPSASTLGAEVGRVTHHRPDPAGLYIVFTSNMPSGATFCGWHAGATVDGRRVAVVYAPNVQQNPACDAGDRVHANTVSAGTRALVNVVAHEAFEAMTDADPGPSTAAWIDDGGAEIGDKCAWQFDAPVTLTNNSRWQLQKEWSNATRRCEQG